jgi:TonB family protein
MNVSIFAGGVMKSDGSAFCPSWLRLPKKSYGKAAAFVLALALAVPAHAADDRAIKSRVAAVYPVIAQRMKITGSVKIEATVDADGNVTAVKTVSGNRVLAPAAEEAVHKWKFEAGAGATTVIVEVNFGG